MPVNPLDYPSATGRPVTQAHSDYCGTHGHAVHVVDAVDSGVCPRCGDVAGVNLCPGSGKSANVNHGRPICPVCHRTKAAGLPLRGWHKKMIVPRHDIKGTTTRKRSAERTKFLAYVLSTALEGGVNYWAMADRIERTGDYPAGDWDYASVRLFEHDGGNEVADCSADGAEGLCAGHVVDLDTIARGLRALPVSERTAAVRLANRTNGDDGDYDAWDADVIVQYGIFGEIVYS